MENNKENMMRNATEQEMEKTTGGDLGDIFDAAVCLIKGHEWKEIKNVGYSGGPRYYQYLCTRCGKFRYTRVDANNVVEISEQEFNRVLHS